MRRLRDIVDKCAKIAQNSMESADLDPLHHLVKPIAELL